jgi:polysaccharide chain length determinant protein (PEP-CTERM system associated)
MMDVLILVRRLAAGVWKHRWKAMLVTWLVCVFGWTTVYLLPDIYEARAQVYVDADSRLAEVMGEVGVAPGVGSRVFIVRQAMLGRPQLARVARETDLDLRARTAAEKEALLLELRDKIGVNSGRTSQAKNLYTISFADRERETALSVVQALLNSFVEDVLDMKAQGSEEVSDYLQDQVQHYQDLLSEAELRLANFKKKNVGLLPNDRGDVFARLQSEMDLINEFRSQLRVETDRREELRRQLGSASPYADESQLSSEAVLGIGKTTNSEIKDLESRRSELMLVYTERHPDVVAVDEQLKILVEKRKAELAEMTGGDSGIEGAADSTNPVYQNVQIALNESGVRVAALRSKIAQSQSTIDRLKTQIDTIPEIEAEYSQLTRDYDQYRSLYNELLMQRERERMGSVGEERDVVTFNIIDPPSVGVEPVAPPRVFLLIAVLVLASAAGIGSAFIMDQLRPVFHDHKTLASVTGRPVLGIVSLTWVDRHKSMRQRELSAFVTVGVALLGVFILVVAFNEEGVRAMHQLIWRVTG